MVKILKIRLYPFNKLLTTEKLYIFNQTYFTSSTPPYAFDPPIILSGSFDIAIQNKRLSIPVHSTPDDLIAPYYLRKLTDYVPLGILYTYCKHTISILYYAGGRILIRGMKPAISVHLALG